MSGGGRNALESLLDELDAAESVEKLMRAEQTASAPAPAWEEYSGAGGRQGGGSFQVGQVRTRGRIWWHAFRFCIATPHLTSFFFFSF